MNNNYSRCSSLRSLPRRKFDEISNNQVLNCEECKTKLPQKCETCDILIKSWDLYYWANIPAKYWNLEMEIGFQGPKVLVEKYKDICTNLKQSYLDGISYCFAGKHGLGKTMTICNILKRSVEKGYSALYVNLGDIVEITLHGNNERFDARKELLMVDFLAIDEFDSRFMPSDNSALLFGRVLEGIFRTRSQNTLPTLMCTNSTNIIESFPKDSLIKASIESLMNNVLEIPLFGPDYRKKEQEVLKEKEKEKKKKEGNVGR